MSAKDTSAAERPAVPPPFENLTLARIYLAQGKCDQAEAMLRRLFADRPDDKRLTAALAEVAERRAQDAHDGMHADHLRLSTEPAGVRCTWVITRDGQDRAAAVLNHPGTLCLRLLFGLPLPRLVPHDTLLKSLAGSVTVPQLPDVITVLGSVGLRDRQGAFVSIAHAPLLALTPSLKESKGCSQVHSPR